MQADENESSARAKTAQEAAVEKFRSRPDTETGLDRVKEMFTITNWELSPELSMNGEFRAFKYSCSIVDEFINAFCELIQDHNSELAIFRHSGLVILIFVFRPQSPC